MSVSASSNRFVNEWNQLVDGTEIEIMIRNASGGTLGELSWGAGYRTSWSNVTDKPSGAGGGFNVTLRFRCDSASGTWKCR
jgi:hypothetical protein